MLEKATSQFYSQTTVPICLSLVPTGGLRWGKKTNAMHNVHSLDFLSLFHTREYLCWRPVTLPRGIIAPPTREYWVRGQQRPTATEPWDPHKLNKYTQPGWKYTIVSVISSNHTIKSHTLIVINTGSDTANSSASNDGPLFWHKYHVEGAITC